MKILSTFSESVRILRFNNMADFLLATSTSVVSKVLREKGKVWAARPSEGTVSGTWHF